MCNAPAQMWEILEISGDLRIFFQPVYFNIATRLQPGDMRRFQALARAVFGEGGLDFVGARVALRDSSEGASEARRPDGRPTRGRADHSIDERISGLFVARIKIPSHRATW